MAKRSNEIINKFSVLKSEAKDYIEVRVAKDDFVSKQKAFNEFILFKLAELSLNKKKS